MKEYSFFQYQTNEALHMTENERKIYLSLLLQLRRTLGQNNNKYRDSIIVTYIELILKYCKRFYDRQFTAREASNHDLLKRFNNLLTAYLNSERLVAAYDLGFEYPQHLSRLFKKYTEQTPSEYQNKMQKQ